MALNKHLEFKIELGEQVPATILTDSRRLKQIIRNLLSNAFKFTERGSVTFLLDVATQGWNPEHTSLAEAEYVIAFSVIDTGIGIATEKQNVVFEAFQQADGTTSRKYGGTGLGLSISREIAGLLNGEIRLVSEVGVGSNFSFYLPQHSDYLPTHRENGEQLVEVVVTESSNGGVAKTLPSTATSTPNLKLSALVDDRGNIQSGDQTILIIDDDLQFAKQLVDMAWERQFKVLYAPTGDAGFSMADNYMPSAILMDVELPAVNGWQLLDRSKHSSKTRHIPVHIFTALDERKRGIRQGALTYHRKPVNRTVLKRLFTQVQDYVNRLTKNLLVVEDDEIQCNEIVRLISGNDVQTIAVGTGQEALDALKTKIFDCLVLDLKLPDMSGFELLEKIKQNHHLEDMPIIIYTGKALTKKEETELRRMAETIIIKDVYSMERLLAETSLYLHRPDRNLPPEKRQMVEQVYRIDNVLRDRKILIVDDDIRNIFVLTSILEQHQVQVLYAENGRDGIKALENSPDVDLVLMDIMMPEMDGYETTRAIRKNKKFAKLPIIALTAKAMQNDREKCLEAGASDYITKPVNTDQLLSLMRAWLYR
jgi:CheY-like chemotaxis protein